jgi:DAACS family dicarboxylate/amino acid:cation (Na+ or H+) symporter
MGNLGRVGFKTFTYFVLTMTVATVIGLTLVNTVRPGEGLPEEKRIALMERYKGDVAKTEKPAEFGVQTFVDIVPRPVDSAAGSICSASSSLPDGRHRPIAHRPGQGPSGGGPARWCQRGDGGDHQYRHADPFGVFAFIFKVTAEQGPDILVTLGLYVVVVVVGLAIQMFVVLSVLVATLSRINPLEFFRRVWP